MERLTLSGTAPQTKKYNNNNNEYTYELNKIKIIYVHSVENTKIFYRWTCLDNLTFGWNTGKITSVFTLKKVQVLRFSDFFR